MKSQEQPRGQASHAVAGRSHGEGNIKPNLTIPWLWHQQLLQTWAGVIPRSRTTMEAFAEWKGNRYGN